MKPNNVAGTGIAVCGVPAVRTITAGTARRRLIMAQQDRLSTGLFRDRDSAERAYQDLLTRGYKSDDINVVMTDEARKRHFAGTGATSELGNKALEGAGVGAGVGAVTGGALAAIAAAATVAVPGLGLIVAGPIAAALAGAGAGAVTGGAIGALVGAGIPEDRMKEYESGLKEGGIVMGVRPRTAADEAYFNREWRSERAADRRA
jgi:hypothetical protein